MESKLYKLEIKFAEVKTSRPIDTKTLSLFINCGSTSNILKFQGTVSLGLANFSSDTALELRLDENEQTLGTGLTILSKLCEKTLTGDFKK